MHPPTGDTPFERDANPNLSPYRPDGGQRLVLVVDDDPALAESVRIWIEQQNEWRAETATSGDKALCRYGPHVDAIFLDRRLSRTSNARRS